MKYSLIALLVIFLFSAMSIYSISFVLYPMAKEINVPISSIEFAIPLSWIGGAIGGVIMGIVGDYWGRRHALLLSILLFSIPMIVNI
ncbi:MAG: MFS transporter, partial [Sulfolobus sp.]|nr:MFS transporter [Sulfolobus sp.]